MSLTIVRPYALFYSVSFCFLVVFLFLLVLFVLFVFSLFCFGQPKTKGLVFLSLTYMTHSSLIVVTVLLLRYRGCAWALHQNLLQNRFNLRGMRDRGGRTCRIHRQTSNAGAELLVYSALHSTSSPFYKLKLVVIYLRISKLYNDWLMQCFWNKTKDKETALLAVNRVLGLARDGENYLDHM